MEENTTLETTMDEMEGKYLTFWIESQLYGIPIADVVQIIRMQEITEIPESPYYAKGVINLRGEIIPVIDMRLRLNKEPAEYNDFTCIIITSIRGKSFGFVVDKVDEVTERIPEENMSSPPALGSDGVSQYLTGVVRLRGRLILMLATSKLLGVQEFDALSDAAYDMSVMM